MDHRPRAHEIRDTVDRVDEMKEALDAEGIPYRIKKKRIPLGGGEYNTRIDVLIPDGDGGWESYKPFLVAG